MMLEIVVKLLDALFRPRHKSTLASTDDAPREYRLHLPRSLMYELSEVTRPNFEHPEPLAFLRVRFATEVSKNVLVGIGVSPFPAEAYVDGDVGANFSTDWAVSVANAEMGSNVGLLLVHSHGGPGMPTFSGIDQRTNRSVMAALAIGIQSAPYGALVLSDTRARCVLAVERRLQELQVVVVPDRLGNMRMTA
jgi:hypothetical protein